MEPLQFKDPYNEFERRIIRIALIFFLLIGITKIALILMTDLVKILTDLVRVIFGG